MTNLEYENLEFKSFLETYKKTIALCRLKFKLDEDLILYKLYYIMNHQTKINNINAYIYTVMKNLKYAINKKQKQEDELQHKCSVDDLKIDFQSNIEFFNLLNCLTLSDKRIIILRYLHSFTIREISNITKMKKSTVDYRIKRAHKLIAHELLS